MVDLLPLADAARRVHRAEVTLRKAAERGLLKAEKVAGRWVTTEADPAAHVARRRSRGRPSSKMER